MNQLIKRLYSRAAMTLALMERRAAAALALIVLTLTAQGAWADTETVSYIDADGNEQTVTATVLTGNEEPNQYGFIELAAGWYVVKGNISYTDQIGYGSPTGTIHIILADGAQMAVEYNGKDAIFLSKYYPLAIYGQSAGTGRLSVTSDRDAIYARGGITINGGIVSATSTGSGSSAIYTNYGAITINGGQVTATPGDNAMGISTEGTITLGLRSASDFITANGYYGTVNIKDGQALKAPSGNIYYGTLTDAQKSAIANVTLQPATQAEFIAAALPQTAADTYTISDAAGWDAFCLALQDNDTWNRFSGKTVRLAADITVTRMAGGDSHDFTGTFDGGGHTLTLDYGTADAPVDAQFVAPFVETASGTSPVFRNLTIAGTIYEGYTGSEAHNVGGLIGHLFGTVTIEHCTSNVSINATSGAGGFVGLCEHSVSFNDCHSAAVITSPGGNNSGFVAWSRSSAWEINFTGCLFDGKLLQQNGNGASNGGFIGWKGDAKTVNITNSLCAPAPLATGETMASSNSATFSREHSNYAATIQNCYYTAAFDIAQGKATRTVAAATDVTIGAVALTGTAIQYTVSGITAYSGGGLQRGQTLYYGSGDQLSLTLSNTATGAPRGYQYGYTASAGTLSGSTLTMPDQDVTISAVLAPIDWATVNQGKSADPYMIYNKDQLLLLAHRVNGTNGETANSYVGKFFKLGADITFDHPVAEPDDYAENYEAIGGNIDGTARYFNGNFYGDGHTVSGIRIRKTGSDDANSIQGLFGYIGTGAIIHDVHLTDARIRGYNYVGGIVGINNSGYIMRCTVTDSYITVTRNRNYGTICGYTTYTNRLTNNYYHGCTVNGTAVTSGVGCMEADIAANNGALPAYRLDLGANITTPPGTFAGQTEWLATPPVDARLAPENGFTLAGNHYFASGYEFTPGSTLASGAAQGYTPRATLDDVLLDLYTPTGDAPDYTGTAIARFTITADCDGMTLKAALRSDGLEHEVSYMTADGTEQTAQAVALDGTEDDLEAGNYFVGMPTVSFDHTLNLKNGDVTLILADGCSMNIGTSASRFEGRGFDSWYGHNTTLTICGQSLDEATAGNLNIYLNGSVIGIHVRKGYTQHSGNVTIDITGDSDRGIYALESTSAITINGGTLSVTADGYPAIWGEGTVNINGGKVDADGKYYCITAGGDITINGGIVNAKGSNYGIRTWSNGNIILGWTNATDRIYANGYNTENGTIAVASGKAFVTDDATPSVVSGTLAASAIAGKTLSPCLQLADNADNGATIGGFSGKAIAVQLQGRKLWKDGAWNTLCLPFSVALAGSPLEGADARKLTEASISGSTLNLTFSDKNAVTTIEAGRPYIIKWERADDYADDDAHNIVSPVFSNVTVSTADNSYDNAVSGDLRVRFIGTYKGTIFETEDKSILLMGAGNQLFYPQPSGGQNPSLGAQRAYFKIGEDGSQQARQLTGFNITYDGESTTGIIEAEADSSLFTIHSSLSEWYSLDGRKLQGKPTKRGVYLNNGKKVVVK